MRLKFIAVFISLLISCLSIAECENIDQRFKLSESQLATAEKSWGGALYGHHKKLSENFEYYLPFDQVGFDRYIQNDWAAKWQINRDKMDCGWTKFGWPVDPDYQELRKIHSEMTNLNSVKVKMLFYFRQPTQKDLEYITSNMERIEALSSKYSEFEPSAGYTPENDDE